MQGRRLKASESVVVATKKKKISITLEKSLRTDFLFKKVAHFCLRRMPGNVSITSFGNPANQPLLIASTLLLLVHLSGDSSSILFSATASARFPQGISCNDISATDALKMIYVLGRFLHFLQTETTSVAPC